MLSNTVGYDLDMIQEMNLSDIKPEEITSSLKEYLDKYSSCFKNKSQKKYFDVFVRGLMSDLDRKTIEPIALSFLEDKDVRGFQQFFKRAKLADEEIKKQYHRVLAENISAPDGFLCVDGSDFPKKGENSVGVYRQHCGRLGKTENCQAGVFASYVSRQGYALLDGQIYLPKAWFSEEYEKRRLKSEIPEEVEFKTKNEIASEMITKIIEQGLFEVKWVGCDAAFGCDHRFLESIPEGVNYFAAIKENELIFRSMPEMKVPETHDGKSGRRFKHPRPSFAPVTVKSIAEDESLPWEKRILAQGAKGAIIAEVKCIRCVKCKSTTKYGNYVAPDGEIWLFIRKYEDGSIKYFTSNAPADTDECVLNQLATMRWSIEQCFQECKSYLGMTHYETVTYIAWHRHMMLVMIAHLFTLYLRILFKKNFI